MTKYQIKRTHEILHNNRTPYILLPQWHRAVLERLDDKYVYANIMGMLYPRSTINRQPYTVYTIDANVEIDFTFNEIVDILRVNTLPFFMLSEYEQAIIRNIYLVKCMTKVGTFMTVRSNHKIDEMKVYRIHRYLKIDEFNLSEGD